MPKTLQHARQLAQISCRVIREIQEWQKFRQDSYLKKSNTLSVGLRDNIIRTIDSLQNVSNQAKNQISQFFVNGVEIKQPYMQNRVKLATENSKVIFIPTLMTSNVFNLLLCDPYLISVVDGHYGVSKSFSSILLSLLSRYISDYKILRYPYYSQPYYFWSQKNELSQFETEKNRQNINRYLYWRIDPEKDNVNSLHQSILQQLSPLEQQLIQRRRTGENRLFCDINHNLRRIGMEPFLIIDNLSSLLSKIRNTGYKHNTHYQGRYVIPQTSSFPTQYTTKRTNSHVTQYRQNFKKNIQSIRSLQECLYQAKHLYSFSVSLLSVNAEQDLMKQIQLSDSQIYPIYKKIDFLRNYRLHIDDLTDFLIILMENYSKIKISPMTKMQFKEKISEQIAHNVTIKERILLTHLDIVHFCRSEVQYLKSIIEQKNAEKRSKSLKQMVKKIKLHNETRFIDALKTFINKRTHHNENNHHETWIVKSLLISSIIQNLQAEDLQKLNHMEKIQYTLKQCRFVKSKYAVWIYKKIMDNRFFYIENDKVVIPFPSRIIKIASDKQFKRLLLETLMNYCADIVLQISPSGSARGGIIQNSFKYAALQSTEIKLCLNKQTSNGERQDKNIKQHKTGLKKYSNLGKSAYFRSIPKFIKSYDEKQIDYSKKKLFRTYSLIEEVLSQAINLSIQLKSSQDQILCKILEPITDYEYCFPSSTPKINQISKSIDFIILEMTHNKLQVNCFDVTLRSCQIKTKIRNFLENYLHFNDNKTKQIKLHNTSYDLQINYGIVCPMLENEKYQIKNFVSNQVLSKHLDFIQNSNFSELQIKSDQDFNLNYVRIFKMQNTQFHNKDNFLRKPIPLFKSITEKVIHDLDQEQKIRVAKKIFFKENILKRKKAKEFNKNGP